MTCTRRRKTVLDLDLLTGSRPDAVVVFDEFFNYPGLAAARVSGPGPNSSSETGRTFEYLAYTGNNEQVVVRLH